MSCSCLIYVTTTCCHVLSKNATWWTQMIRLEKNHEYHKRARIRSTAGEIFQRHIIHESDSGYRFQWDVSNLRFHNPPTQQESDTLLQRYCVEHRQCLSCATQKKEENESECFKSPSGIIMQHLTYHLNDFVYFRNSHSGILSVGQIVDLLLSDLSSTIEICPFIPYGKLKNSSKDEVEDYKYLVCSRYFGGERDF